MTKLTAYIFATSLLIHAGCKPSQPATNSVATGNTVITTNLALPLDLRTNYTTPVSYFDQITQFPAWKTVPRGHQVFDGVPLDIEGMICLWGEGNATELKIVFPEEILGIVIKQKFETLYVYHGSFFKSPDNTPVCAVVFGYADGSSVTNQMLYGEDVIDWVDWEAGNNQDVSGPTGSRSKLAWVGGAFSPTENRPLRLCLTAIENPQPFVEVETIDLFSCKSRTAPCIMAMTPGKSGLMR
jgi:hypothetical protein